jgi:hypothetical protein
MSHEEIPKRCLRIGIQDISRRTLRRTAGDGYQKITDDLARNVFCPVPQTWILNITTADQPLSQAAQFCITDESGGVIGNPRICLVVHTTHFLSKHYVKLR